MEKVTTVLQVVVPIFAAIFLGVFARKKKILTQEENRGLQQFVTNFGLPCVLFNSCLSADLGVESLSSMVMVLVPLLIATFWAFRARKDKYPYHNLPMLFAAQESGMLGIPLFMTLFGTQQAYRMGVLDMTQIVTSIPVIAILTAKVGDNTTPAAIVKKVFQSPLLLMSLLGLALNLSGTADWLNSVGVGGIITETTGFLAQPVSAAILFSVGYNFSLGEGSRSQIFKLCGVHFGYFAVVGVIAQLFMFLIPSVDPQTRWAMLLYSSLPASYLAPSLGRNEKDYIVASGVCSMLTVVCLLVFCVIAVIVA